MFCMNCGKEIPQGGKFCPFCGTAVPKEALDQAAASAAETASAPAASAPAPEPKAEAPAPVLSEYNGEWIESEQAYVFDLDGYTLSFGKEHVVYGNVRNVFLPLWQEGRQQVDALYEQADSVETVLGAYYSMEFLRRALAEPIQRALDICAEYGEFDITEAAVLQTPSLRLQGEERSVISAWELGISPLLEQYQAICQAAQNERERRAYRKETRMRLEGGGFGLTGALTAIAKAGAFNITSGAAHSAFNAVGNALTGAAEKRQLKTLFQSRATRDAMKQAYDNAFSTLMAFVTHRLGGSELTKSDVEKGKLILANIESGRIAGAQIPHAILEGLLANPFNEELYKAYMKYVPDTNGRLNKIAELFNMEDRISKGKEEILSAWIEGCDEEQRDRLEALQNIAQGHATEKGLDVYLRLDGLAHMDEDANLLWDWYAKMGEEEVLVMANLSQQAHDDYEILQECWERPVKKGTIPYAALAGNPMTEYTVPDGVTEIGEYAFADCHNLKSLVLPESLRHIGPCAFVGCGALTELVLPAGVETYSADAYTTEGGTVRFAGEPEITGDIEDFDGSDAVWDIPLWGKLYTWCREKNLLQQTTIYCQEDGKDVLPLRPEDGFYLRDYWKYPPLSVRQQERKEDEEFPIVEVLNTFRPCKAIDAETFVGADITYAVVPDDVQVIGSRAFYGSYLTEIQLGRNVVRLEPSALAGCTYLRKVMLPEGLQFVGDRAFAGSFFLDHLQALQKHCHIGDDIFDGMAVVVECLPDSDWERWCRDHDVRYFYHGQANPYEALLQRRRKIVSEEGLYVRRNYLSDLKKWKEGAQPEGKTKGFFGWSNSSRKYQLLFQAEANGDDTELLSDIIRNGGKHLTGKSRDGKRKITIDPVTVDDSMIATGALIGAEMVYFVAEEAEYISTYACYHAHMVAFCGEEVKEIWEHAFDGCDNLSVVILGDELTRIEDRAFANCPQLEVLYIPSSVTELGQDVFAGTPVTIRCEQGSAAEAYCQDHGIPTVPV